ncbi:phosphoglycerate kinase [Candidatus Parcubacteria bacterium]|nr:phosphoglycerate kinase [Candidatus Parcubacteria bacterium]
MPTKFDLPSLSGAKDLKGKRVLLRLDLNVPQDGDTILDDTRLWKALPTLEFLKKKGARVIAISHLGHDGTCSMKGVARRLAKLIPVGFVPEVSGPLVEKAVASMKNGSIILLENVRRDEGETKNRPLFALSLASLADYYVNDAFSVSHRTHASIVSLPKLLPSFVGLQFEKEVRALSALFSPKRPFLFILGGAKLETKLPLIKKYLKIADYVYVAGALANPFFKTWGFGIGKSIADDAGEDLVALLKHKKLLLPEDVVVDGPGIAAPGIVRRIDEVKKKETIRDIGPDSLEALLKLVARSREILFNGPLGYYELGFSKPTEDLLRAIGKSKADSTVGGGDTLALITKLNLESKFSFVSTAGGAMIDFLSEGTLPGIEALKKSK